MKTPRTEPPVGQSSKGAARISLDAEVVDFWHGQPLSHTPKNRSSCAYLSRKSPISTSHYTPSRPASPHPPPKCHHPPPAGAVPRPRPLRTSPAASAHSRPGAGRPPSTPGCAAARRAGRSRPSRFGSPSTPRGGHLIEVVCYRVYVGLGRCHPVCR